jgi:glycosyltransferase involved in cell wall biosynthesis
VGKPFEPQTDSRINEIRKKYNLNKPYFLFVGTHQPRKNLAGLFKAFEKLNTSSYELVIVGEKGNVFIASAEQASNATYRRLGYIPDSDLPALYAGSTATLSTSLYEGSALTALEAMACGAPVIASNTTAFPEVIGDAAILIDPLNTNEIIDAIKSIIEDRSLANTLRERGLQRAEKFTWDESARRTQSLLESLV